MLTPDEMTTLLTQTIPIIQQRLMALDRSGPVTVEQMAALLDVERANKNRRGIIEWLKLGIETGRLPDPKYHLGYQDQVSCVRSALQKYVRRSMTEKAVRAAKRLYQMSRVQAMRRMKIIIVEDAFSAVELLRYFDDQMSLNEFLGVAQAAAEAPKDKSLCKLGEELTEGWRAPTLERVEPDVGWLKEHLLDKAHFEDVVTQLYRLAQMKRLDLLYEVVGHDEIVDQCIGRVEGGTYWASDSVLLIMAAVRWLQKDYALKGLSLPSVDGNTVTALMLSELDPFCLDFHTPIGRVAKLWFLKRHPDVQERELEIAWFHAESAKLGGVIEADWEHPYNRELWARYGGEVMRLVQDVMRKFELDRYGRLA